MIIFTYIFLLLFMLIIIINGIIVCFKYAPLKIRILSLFVLVLLGFRFVTLIIFYIHESINYLYLLRTLYFADILCIPIIAFIVLYILSRNDKIKFKFIIVISSILVLLFYFLIINGRINLILSNNSFYTMTISSSSVVNILYIIINIFLIIFSIFMINKSNVNKMGFTLILIAAIVVICEIGLSFIKVAPFSEKILGDMAWVATLNYALYELKK